MSIFDDFDNIEEHAIHDSQKEDEVGSHRGDVIYLAQLQLCEGFAKEINDRIMEKLFKQ